MTQILSKIGRRLLRAWGRSGKAWGWHYDAVERWGARLAAGTPLPAMLVNGCRIECDLQDDIQRHIYFFGLYEAVESYFFCRLLRPGMTVIDAGAHVGQYTLLAATGVGPSGEVHSFEPAPKSFESLERHVRGNHLANVHLNRAALWSKPTRLSMSLAADKTQNPGAYSIGGHNPATRIDCQALRLDDYLAERKAGPVHLVKMDIEGAELPALQGMARLLESQRPTLLLEMSLLTAEKLGHSPEQIWDLLVNNLRYRAWKIDTANATCRPAACLDEIDWRRWQNVLFHAGALPETIAGEWDCKTIYRWARTPSITWLHSCLGNPRSNRRRCVFSGGANDDQ